MVKRMLGSMPDLEAYTVGWVCPAANELAAAKLCLDKEHPKLEHHLAPNDNNAYTLGEINRHNVVIANFPLGSQGEVAASNVATNLVRSFKNVRVVLVVGIGGGAPIPSERDHDIRLGDIVVSCPGDSHPGVIQYDYGKLIQGKGFYQTMSSNRPSPALLAGVSQLEADLKVNRNRLEQAINAIIGSQDEELQDELKRPDKESDKLFKSEITHNIGQSCAAGCASSESNIVTRPPRKFRPKDPRVFYGLVASANRLMKDAPLRDQYARERKVLCFGMEAAGLINNFPCLVIQGISNYSDTHKNDQWQPYAALAAAIYARELLANIPPYQVEGQEHIANVISTVERMGKKVDQMSGDVRDMLRDREAQAVSDWLAPSGYNTAHSNILWRWQPLTGQWLIESDKFENKGSRRN